MVPPGPSRSERGLVSVTPLQYHAVSMAAPVTRERVVETALDIVQSEGADGLTMRALAAKLGVAVTAIYWHVGNKDALLAELVDRIADDVGRVTVRGSTPVNRIRSIGRSLRRNLLVHADLVAVVQSQGRHQAVFDTTWRLLAEEFATAGLHGAGATVAVDAVVHLVVGSVLIERATQRTPEPRPPDESRPVDHDQVFERALDALVRGLITGGG